jgi:peptidyl-prolyl cis-trans isomerase SurA
MNKNRFLLLMTLFCLSNFLFAQEAKDPVILNIAGENVPRSEFERVFKKNNNKDTDYSRKAVNEYLQLYINYKLKVREALESGMDTVQAFVDELSGYRSQLAQPYLVDKDVTENLLKEAYERMKTDLRASHILIKCDQNALPKDTLEAYNKAAKIRADLLKGADFNTTARKFSEDPSAKDNAGDLGYFSAMQMVYPFESAAFNTKIGEVSQIVRTRFGYHLIKVTDSRPAQGEVRVAHIMVKIGTGASAEDSIKASQKINEIYSKLNAGEKFEDLARQFSDDPSSAKSGGALPMFGTGRMVPEFERAAFDLKEVNDYSKPTRTTYGWHIIRLLEKKPLGTYEQLQAELKQKIQKDSRSDLSKTSMISKIKKKYGFKEIPKAKAEVISRADSSLIEARWTADKADGLNATIFNLGNKSFSQQDFAKYMVDHQAKRGQGGNATHVANALYIEFVNQSCLDYEESKLDSLYPDFRNLMQEYRDGILLFELTDKKVWSKAVKDTVGLKEFYDSNKNNYMWKDRLEATIYICANADIAAQTRKLMKKIDDADTLAARINKNSQLNLQVKYGKFMKGENEIIDKIEWKEGMTKDMVEDKQVTFVKVHKMIPAQPKTLEEAKGLVTADYQNSLEKEWISSLQKKYPVKVFEDIVESVSKN